MHAPSAIASLALFAPTISALAQTAPSSPPPAPVQAPAAAPAQNDASVPVMPEGIVAKGVTIERIASGHRFTEGPVWLNLPGTPAGGKLFYSDIPQDSIFEWTPPVDGKLDGAVEMPKPVLFAKPSGNANGLIIGPGGVVIAAAHAGRLAIVGADGAGRTLVEKFEGKSLNSPNDLCAAAEGTIYFTDPPYGVRPPLGPTGRSRELEFSGVYRLSSDGTLTLLNKDFKTPNGIAFSPDDKTLYVADTSGGKIHAFAVKPDGSLGEPRVFAEVINTKSGKSAGPDGVKVDAKGSVYCAASDGVRVFDAAGKNLGTIATPTGASNLCFGGPKNDWLFITSQANVYRVRVLIPGRVTPMPKLPNENATPAAKP